MDFEALLNESVKIHGHLCPGQVLGVKMSMLGLREIGIEDPKAKTGKALSYLLRWTDALLMQCSQLQGAASGTGP